MLNKRISSVMCALAISLVAIMLIASIEVVGAVDPILSNSGGGNWQYYREITITEKSGNTLTDYQVLLQLSGNNFPTTKISDGADIRFTDINGNELYYWIEKWDYSGRNAYIWVKVPSIPANGKSTIKMYYGNPSASTFSNVKTFIREIDGVVGSWHFDEGYGSVLNDNSGNVNDGEIYGATWIDGKFGKALNLDGNNDYVEVPDSKSLDLSDAFTLEAWIYQRSAIVSGYRIIDKCTAYTFNGYTFDTFVDWKEPGQRLRLCAAGSCINANTIYSLRNWHHVIVTFNDGNVKFYLDGSLDGKSITSSKMSTNNLPLRIGYCGGGDCKTEYFNGKIDEVRIYNRALSGEEVLDIYNNYGYTFDEYPGKVLVRKYAFPEPTIILSAENELLTKTSTTTPTSTTTSTQTATFPNQPQYLKATAGDDYINLRWEAPSDDGGSSITSYKIYRGTTSGKETMLIKVENVLAYKDNDVTYGQTYYYNVRAINSKGEGAKSNDVSATISTVTSTSRASPGEGGIFQTTTESEKLLQLMGVILIVSGLFFTAITSIKKDVSIEFGVSERNLKYVGGTGVLLIIIGVYILLRCTNLI